VLVVVETSALNPKRKLVKPFWTDPAPIAHLPKDGFDDFTTSRQAFTLVNLGFLLGHKSDQLAAQPLRSFRLCWAAANAAPVPDERLIETVVSDKTFGGRNRLKSSPQSFNCDRKSLTQPSFFSTSSSSNVGFRTSWGVSRKAIIF